ncbi:MAG: polynucleotide adenylyltransferase PcnB [Spirochaetota bacterium]
MRYTTRNRRGKRIKIAHIYTLPEHGIKKGRVDRDALKIVNRLHDAGYQVYIVGGAVRDMLLGIDPKDIDIVTDALPNTIRKLFRQARIIGRRFRLVHIQLGRKIFEVSTFRAKTEVQKNVYGTMEEDVHRRDFTINALYYCPIKEQIIDYVGGVKDIRSAKIRALLPPAKSFMEDPVRMIRAIKYASITGFSLPLKIKKYIQKYAGELWNCSSSRLTEEMLKILKSGFSKKIMEYSLKLNVFNYFFPGMAALIDNVPDNKRQKGTWKKNFLENLERLDREVGTYGDVKRGKMLAVFCESFLTRAVAWDVEPSLLHQEIFLALKRMLRPMTPPNKDVEQAVKIILHGKRQALTPGQRISSL